MEFINDVLGAMKLPGSTFLGTVGAGAAMYFGVVLAKVAIGFGSRLLGQVQNAARTGGQTVRGRR